MAVLAFATAVVLPVLVTVVLINVFYPTKPL